MNNVSESISAVFLNSDLSRSGAAGQNPGCEGSDRRDPRGNPENTSALQQRGGKITEREKEKTCWPELRNVRKPVNSNHSL